jgi:hypothetical protein
MDEVDYYKQNDKSVCALIKRLENSSGWLQPLTRLNLPLSDK